MEAIIFLSIEKIITINDQHIRLFGGMHGVRDVNLLESAVARPQTTFGGVFAYHDEYTMAAVYAHGIIKNHPFIDGNKRTGMAAALIFLDINGFEASLSNDDVFDLGIALATSKISYEMVAEIFQYSSRKG